MSKSAVLPSHRIETRKVADLRPADYNPRKIDEKAHAGLTKSIERFGAVQPIIVNERTGNVVGGHQRLKSLERLGQVETTVVVIDIDPMEEKALNVALNNPAISGEFTDGLGDILDQISVEMPDLFMDLRLDALLGDAVPQIVDGETDPDAAPEPPPQAVTKPGDLWIMGEHRLICGSCTDAGAVDAVMNGGRADLCLTDPPYGLGNTDSEKNDYAEYEDTRDNLVDLVAAFLPIAQSVAPVVVLTPGCMNAHVYPRPLWTMAWFTPAGAGIGPWGWVCWQPILCYGKDPKTQKGKGSHPDAIVHTEAAEKFGHPCTKPIKFWCWLMERTSERGETIYEPFSGSGTTVIAGEQIGRKVYAVELSPEYVDVAVLRWQAFTGKQATLDGDGRTFDEVAESRRDAA